MSETVCANCGYPQREHSYNGACYGLCGKFVEPAPADEPKGDVRATVTEEHRREARAIGAKLMLPAIVDPTTVKGPWIDAIAAAIAAAAIRSEP